ncbi:Alpha/Beta hydrolase protein [Myxozyma melibiosi]|uniref:Alpha/Beta hydrolase protein n=1 Tax=Myxozyma melibiosi TaxID=54550 RepID=A0ABR1F9A6_9ASCO
MVTSAAEDIGLAPEWMKWETQAGTRPVLSGDIPNMRQQMDGLSQLLKDQWNDFHPLDGGVSTIDLVTPCGLDVRVYQPEDSKGKAVPIGAFYHCGGYCIGGIQVEDTLVRNLCKLSQTVIASIQYRHAPEYPAPTALDDCVRATKWVASNAASWGADPNKLYTMGPSAGAALSISVPLRLHDEGGDSAGLVKGVISLSPCEVHPDHIPEKFKGMHTSAENSAGRLPVIDIESMRTFYSTYTVPLDDKYTFAIYYPKLQVLPPVYIVSAEFDPLRDDAYVFEKLVKEAGGKITHKTYKGLPHVFWLFPLPQSLQFFEDTAKAIKGLF